MVLGPGSPYPARNQKTPFGAQVKDVHLVVGVLAVALNAGVGLAGAWEWWRALSEKWFWWLVRAAQLAVVVQAALGAILVALGHKASSLHILYGVLPILVAVIAAVVVPAEVGVPLICPAALMVRPAGRPVALKVRGAVPPVAFTVAL